jgi:flagellin
MTVINTNMNALFARNSLTINARAMSGAMEQLSTGQRINSAKDDAAGLAISDKMTSQIRGLQQAINNGNDAISLLQTAEGSMVQQTAMLQRMRELAVQASTDTTTVNDKSNIDREYQKLLTQIDNVGKQTQWNGENVLDASHANGNYTFQIGANKNDTVVMQIDDFTIGGTNTKLVGLATTSIDTAADAQNMLGVISSAIDAIDLQRSTLGAGINQLTYSLDNLTNVVQNATASRSRIMDTDYSAASSSLAKAQIIQQAATAMLAQANQQPQTVLALLK